MSTNTILLFLSTKKTNLKKNGSNKGVIEKVNTGEG
jgi:hypothetical protein